MQCGPRIKLTRRSYPEQDKTSPSLNKLVQDLVEYAASHPHTAAAAGTRTDAPLSNIRDIYHTLDLLRSPVRSQSHLENYAADALYYDR